MNSKKPSTKYNSSCNDTVKLSIENSQTRGLISTTIVSLRVQFKYLYKFESPILVFV